MNKTIRLTAPFIVALGVLGVLLLVLHQTAWASDEIYTVCPDGPPICDFSVIQDAVDVASEGDVIEVAAGTYSQINNYGGLAQILYLDKSVTIVGGFDNSFIGPPDPHANPTILDAQGAGRIVYMSNEYAAPRLENFTMTNGDATGLGGTPYGDDAGGGLYLWGGGTVISNCVITENYSGWDGGGIYMHMSSTAQIINSEVSHNQANYGAGIYIWFSHPYIAHNIISDNTGGGAGGVWMGVYSGATFEYNLFDGNTTTDDSNETGAGMVAERSDVTLNQNIFQNNATQGGGAGAVLIRCNAMITNNIFSDNALETNGGALLLTGSDAQLMHNTFARNGGLGNCGVYLATHWEPRVSNATILNTILVSNTVGIYAESSNTANTEAMLWGSGEWANGEDWAGPGDIITGTINFWDDPAFVDPGTADYHITSNSPAVDAGIDAGVSIDIDGQYRPNGPGVDLGADEYWQGIGEMLVTTLEDELNSDGDCSLREAITAANTNLPVDACGSSDVLTDTITFDVAGTITVTSQLSVTAGGPLVIDGGGVITTSGGDMTRVWWVEEGSVLTLINLAVVDGRSTCIGGGIVNWGTLDIINSIIANNCAGLLPCEGPEGGGIFNWGTLTIMDSSVIGNQVYEIGYGSGGGIRNSGNLTIIRTTFSDNLGGRGEEGFGGGITNGYLMTVSDSTFSGNSAGRGGGIDNGGWLTITNSDISSNSAISGGGILNNGDITITNSSIISNTADGGGGIENTGDITITSSSIFSNTAWLGGGIHNYGSLSINESSLYGNTGGGVFNGYTFFYCIASGSMIAENSIISNNTSSPYYGGGIRSICESHVTLNNCSVSNNTTPSVGGGIYNEGSTLVIINTTITGNGSGGIYNDGSGLAINSIIGNSSSGGDCAGVITDGGHNIDSDGSCGLDPENGSLPNTDPLLGPLQDNGGPTWTHALLPGSPAIDAGDNEQCPETDQRGVPRPQDGDGDGEAVCDIGSFEVESPPVPPISVTIVGAESGWLAEVYTFTATTEPITTSLPITYVWQANGQEIITHTSGLTDAVSLTWDMPGTQQITVTASNEFGSVSGGYLITITDQPISGLAAFNDSPTLLGEVTTLSATVTGGTNVVYTWEFGDGTTGIGQVLTHTYAEVGVYTATVTATNTSNSLNATTVVTITVSQPTYWKYLPFTVKGEEQVQGFWRGGRYVE